LQTWFIGTGHHDGKDPYFLYAASNVGSFLALLSYPVVLEPLFTLQVQDRLWTVGFVLLVALIAACAILLLRSPASTVTANDVDAIAAKPNWLTIGRWVFVSAVPSGLLVAVTAHISTDVAAAPLLWIMPLSLYLLTWVLVFARRPVLTQAFMLRVMPFAIAGIVALLLFSGRGSLLNNLAAHLLMFFVIAMACHGELARSRPAPAHLTVFYVSLSFGGMIGGLFAGLVAPNVFSWVAEYPILVVLAVLCRPFAAARGGKFDRWFWPAAALVTVAVIGPAILGWHASATVAAPLYVAILSLAAISVVLALLSAPLKSAVVVALALALIRLYAINEGHSETLRNFFGVTEVFETADHRFRVLKHGSTIHGAQRLLTKDGQAVTGRPEPLTYYHRASGMAATVEAVRARKGAPLRVAGIGLGTGSLVCYIQPGETWRFFEIDPSVIAIARDPARFNFLSACAPNFDIVLGDARLTLAHEPDGAYDLIVVDAYSSDAIPVHLATREAMAIYKAKLAPHGVVTMHITNRHLELRSVVAGIAAANGLKTWAWTNPDDRTDPENFIAHADVVIAAERPEDIGALA
jgi:spermidine synthase